MKPVAVATAADRSLAHHAAVSARSRYPASLQRKEKCAHHARGRVRINAIPAVEQARLNSTISPIFTPFVLSLSKDFMGLTGKSSYREIDMEKVDLKQSLKHLYNPPTKEPVFIDVPLMNYLMVDGHGKPDSPETVAAIEALYPVAYTLKFIVKKEQGIDYGVMPLEGLWWSDDMADFINENKDNWRWTYMIMQPDFITRLMVDNAIAEVRRKKKPTSIDKVVFEMLAEGKAAQIMHIGYYSAEGPNIEKLHRFIKDAGHSFDGMNQKHHEIYLSDPRKSAPEKMKTVIRQPFV
jgi:hypothetical protein